MMVLEPGSYSVLYNEDDFGVYISTSPEACTIHHTCIVARDVLSLDLKSPLPRHRFPIPIYSKHLAHPTSRNEAVFIIKVITKQDIISSTEPTRLPNVKSTQSESQTPMCQNLCSSCRRRPRSVCTSSQHLSQKPSRASKAQKTGPRPCIVQNMYRIGTLASVENMYNKIEVVVSSKSLHIFKNTLLGISISSGVT